MKMTLKVKLFGKQNAVTEQLIHINDGFNINYDDKKEKDVFKNQHRLKYSLVFHRHLFFIPVQHCFQTIFFLFEVLKGPKGGTTFLITKTRKTFFPEKKKPKKWEGRNQ